MAVVVLYSYTVSESGDSSGEAGEAGMSLDAS